MGGNGTCVVTFRVKADTQPGTNIRVVGNSPNMGSWDISRALVMSFQPGGFWTCQVSLPAGCVHEYKYLQCGGDGSLKRWQPGADSVLTIFRDETRLEVRDDWSCDPTLSRVHAADGTIDGRQERLWALLKELRGALETLMVTS